MSIDVAVRMYFPAASAAGVLACLADLTRHGGSRSVAVAPPEGGSYVIRYAEKLWPEDGPGPVGFGPGASLDSIITSLSAVVRRKKRLPKGSKLQFDRWGDVVNHRVVKERVDYPVWLGLGRGQRFIGVSISNITSSDADFFLAAPFRARLARLYAEGGGVAGIYDMDGWRAFDEPTRSIETPAGWWEAEDEPGVDAHAELLQTLL